jgi:hypothetical protein
VMTCRDNVFLLYVGQVMMKKSPEVFKREVFTSCLWGTMCLSRLSAWAVTRCICLHYLTIYC